MRRFGDDLVITFPRTHTKLQSRTIHVLVATAQYSRASTGVNLFLYCDHPGLKFWTCVIQRPSLVLTGIGTPPNVAKRSVPGWWGRKERKAL